MKKKEEKGAGKLVKGKHQKSENIFPNLSDFSEKVMIDNKSL